MAKVSGLGRADGRRAPPVEQRPSSPDRPAPGSHPRGRPGSLAWRVVALDRPSEMVAAPQQVVELAQRLLRADSSNPPGRERACVELLAGELRAAGLEPRILAHTADRPNLVARVRGRGEAPPLLLHGHADVVPASAAAWRHHPFGAALVEGELWGRGALDMKGGLAMLATVIMQAARPGGRPPGDLLFVVNSDEEAGGDQGAAWLVDRHPDLFHGVRHALSEFGGYSHHIAGRRLYPVQVAQKRRCTLRATIRGKGGHAASPRRGRGQPSDASSTATDRAERR